MGILIQSGKIIKKENTMANRNLWSADVETKWHAPEGFFERSAHEIAEGLKKASDSKAQAMERLNFYINRSGKNLSESRKEVLEQAKRDLERIFH